MAVMSLSFQVSSETSLKRMIGKPLKKKFAKASPVASVINRIVTDQSNEIRETFN